MKDRDAFTELGYELLKGFFSGTEIDGIREIVLDANHHWISRNQPALEKGAINSAYLTAPDYCLTETGRSALFQFIALDKIVDLASVLIGRAPCFLNTQLFFNPRSRDRKPYWHRDIQYSGLPEEKQKEAIFQDSVLHFRVPLSGDPGLDFIPGSHRRWDTREERKVRLELDGRRSHESLPNMERVPHEPGDLLVFSAHVLHKGVYGGNRLSLDILFASFKESPDSVKTNGHFPNEKILSEIKNRRIFALK